MKEVNILGASHATISMIVETLGSLHPTGVRVNIVHNVVVEDELPYDVPSVETIKTAHEDWDYEADARKKVPCLCGVYRPSVKKQVFRFFRSRCGTELEHYANLIHPATALASTTRLGTGVTIGPQTVIAPHSFIGDLVSVNRSVSIGHHTVVGNYSTLNPGCNVAGRCRIGTGVTVGMGTNIVEDVTLGDNAVVRGGPHRLDHLAAFLRWTPQFLLPPVREILRGGEPEGKVPLRMFFQASVHLLRRRPSVRRVRSLAVV